MSTIPGVKDEKAAPFPYIQKLHRTFLKPSMTSGLCAINMKQKEITRVMNFEKTLIRRYFGLRKNSSIMVPYMLLGLEPVEVNLERELLSLFWNIWRNKRNPVFKINKRILEKRKKGNFWIWRVDSILRKYGFPQANVLMREKNPTKTQWKNIVKRTITEVQEKKWKKQIMEKSTQREVNVGQLRMDGRVNELLKVQKTPSEEKTSFL